MQVVPDELQFTIESNDRRRNVDQVTEQFADTTDQCCRFGISI